MTLRVNLLQESERRYQGPVSLRLALVLAGSMVGALLALFIVVTAYKHFSLKSSIRSAKNDWQLIEDRYGKIVVKQEELAANKALLDELGLWTKIRPEWSKLLPGLQRIVPPTVQLTRFTAQSEWKYIKPPLPAATETPPEGGKPPKEKPAVPARDFSVGTEGRAQGDLADETVVQFVQLLREAGDYKPLFESVKLQRLTRDANKTDAQADRIFEIQGTFFTRKLE